MSLKISLALIVSTKTHQRLLVLSWCVHKTGNVSFSNFFAVLVRRPNDSKEPAEEKDSIFSARFAFNGSAS